MTQRRTLPPRSTRGKRSQQSYEDQMRQNKLYEKLFQRAENQQDNNRSQNNIIAKPSKALDQKNEYDYKQKIILAASNRSNFPFTRGYHYECQIEKLGRVQGCPSYAMDTDNILKVHYALQQKKIQQWRVGDLINRKLIGLPDLNTTITGIIREKNPCGILLFQNEDKKYAIDRLLVELKYINSNLEKLIQFHRIDSFGCLKKDTELIAITQMETCLQEKRKILNKRIKILQDRKDAMKTFFANEDRLYYGYSLNNQLHTEVSSLEYLITGKYVISNIERREAQRQHIGLNFPAQIEKRIQDLRYLFIYENSDGEKCITSETLRKFALQTGKQFFTKKNGQFVVEFPVCFLAFPDDQIVKILQSYVIARLLNESQTIFYIYKSFWKKVFDRNLQVDKQPKHLSHNDFHKIFMNFVSKINKSTFTKKPLKFPMLDSQLSLFSSQQKNNHRLFNGTPKKITTRQYVALYLFNIVFMGLRVMLPLVENSQNMNNFIRMISSDYYGKYHYVITQINDSVDFGIMHQTMKKALQVLVDPTISEESMLGWVYDEENKYGYIIKSTQATVNSTTLPSISQINIDEYDKGDKRKKFELDEQSDKVIKRRKLVPMEFSQ